MVLSVSACGVHWFDPFDHMLALCYMIKVHQS